MTDPTPLQARLARVTEFREHVAALEGHAESPDGLIKITCTAEDSLRDLQLHPRALKLLNSELAAAIQETATSARADLKRQTDDLVGNLFDPNDPARGLADPGAARARLQELTETMKTMGDDTTAAFDRLREMLGH